MTDMMINKLPSKTWNWLKVNETKLPWDMEHTTVLPEENVAVKEEPVHFSVQGEGEYSSKKFNIHAAKDEQITVYMDYTPENKLAVYTSLTLEEGAHVRLIQLQHSAEDSLVYNSIQGSCEKNARIELVQVYLGKGDIYSDTAIDLKGEKSSFKSDIGYIGEHTHVIDINEVVNHLGRCTESEINVQGSLRDGAKKIFRGTIDFKTGASDSVGNEQETVLMLGEDAVNKTVPVILCAEENVEGTHGATIGEMDDDTRFYFGSRGIDRETAEKLLSRAAIARVAQQVKSETARAAILNELDGEMDENDGLQA